MMCITAVPLRRPVNKNLRSSWIGIAVTLSKSHSTTELAVDVLSFATTSEWREDGAVP